MSSRRAAAAARGVVDTYGPANLLPDLELFIQAVLFGDDFLQCMCHPLELLVGVMELVHVLGERPVYHVVAAGFSGGGLIMMTISPSRLICSSWMAVVTFAASSASWSSCGGMMSARGARGVVAWQRR